MKGTLPVLALALCAALLAVVLYFLFKERFETGDVQPAYSSLRADPMGAMVLYESLQRLPGLTVKQDFSADNRLPAGPDATYLQLAGHQWAWSMLADETVREIETFVLNGGRLVVLFDPDSFHPIFANQKKSDRKAKKDQAKKDDKKTDKKTKPRRLVEDDEDEDDKPVDLEKRWGFKFDNETLQADRDDKINSGTARNVSDLSLPKSIKWNNAGVLKELNASWKPIYQGSGGSVLAVKTMGKGTIVFATDSFFASNEAMPADRQASLLAWLVGENHTVIFDEAHLGIITQSGLATLARKYHLHGVAAALLVLMALFIWKNTQSLLPKYREAAHEIYVPGKDSASGFAALLRRNIPPGRLLSVCFGEWSRTRTHARRETEREKSAVAAILEEEDAKPTRAQDPVKTYQRIVAALDRRGKLRPSPPANPASP